MTTKPDQESRYWLTPKGYAALATLEQQPTTQPDTTQEQQP